MSSIWVELRDATGESSREPLRLAEAANKLRDQQWDRLSEPAQMWVNSVLMERDRAYKEGRAPQFPSLAESSPVSIQLRLSVYPGSVGVLLAKLVDILDTTLSVVVTSEGPSLAVGAPPSKPKTLSLATRRKISASMKRSHAARKSGKKKRR